MNAIIWNVRSVKSMQAFEKLITMQRQHHFKFIGIMEPKQKRKKLERYRRRIGMLQAFSNVSNKIWVFVDDDHGVDIVYDLEQQLTLKFTNLDIQISFVVTFVYAKCDSIEPLACGGDFNVTWDEEEKFGGLPISLNEINDFRHCITTCNLSDLGFKGSIYTWWNGRGEADCIFKRLDRCLGNLELQQLWPGIEVTHLSKIGSDHSPMLLNFNPNAAPIKKAFKFLNFWCKHSTFKEVVLQNWKADFTGDPFFVFNHKLKKLKKALSLWSRATYGDIFQKIASLEEVVLVHEIQFERFPTVQNRERLQKVQAELLRFLAFEEEFWKQKSGMSWFQYGDRNTKFFHAQVNGRRRRLQLKRVQDSNGIWLENSKDMADEAVRFFQAQFHEDTVSTAFDIFDHVPALVDHAQNKELIQQPTKEEVRHAVFGLNGESAGGPDGFTRSFFQTCWDIIGDDIVDMVKALFNGHDFPRYVTHTNLVLLPKKKEVVTFSDVRPISLSNFVNKIFSRVVHGRLAVLLPNLISEEQTGFVKGRNIVENVLLTQEIIVAEAKCI
ncbi:uncharacterized protein LOC142180816 [Nicotiana tabacum]|uniref:Uncharacterized protein LOC142180816 n=1 Tax=Nicotiana tabacum TaxID=4097 RepID=A0AC58UHN5_TOBAC